MAGRHGREMMMKRLTVISFGLLLAAPLMAEEVDRTLDAAADGEIDVSNIAGSVTMHGWSRKEVEVTGIIGVKDGQKTILAHSFLSL